MKQAKVKIIEPEPQPVTLEESKRLIFLEKEIALSIESFIEVGNHLVEIRDTHLYRIEHLTFEDYCEKRWEIPRWRAYELIDVAKVSKNVGKSLQISTATELAQLPAAEQAPALEEATNAAQAEGKDKPTVKDVKKEVKKRKAKGDKGEDYKSALKYIARVCGSELEGHIIAGTRLSEREVIMMAKIEEDECKRITPYILAGWKLKAALGYKATSLTYAHTIRQLCDRAIEFGKFTLDLDDWTITVTKKETQPESKLPEELTGKSK